MHISIYLKMMEIHFCLMKWHFIIIKNLLLDFQSEKNKPLNFDFPSSMCLTFYFSVFEAICSIVLTVDFLLKGSHVLYLNHNSLSGSKEIIIELEWRFVQ